MGGKWAWALATEPTDPFRLSLGSCFLRGSRAQGRGQGACGSWRTTTHSLEQAKDEGIEAHGVTGELWELADFVVEAVQDLGRWAWEEARVESHTLNLWNPKFTLQSPTCTQDLPSCVEASTTLHGMFLRCPMMTSSTKALSPSSSTARTAGHKYFRTRWPTLGLTELFPSFAYGRSREVQGIIWSPTLVLFNALSPAGASAGVPIPRYQF